MKLLPVLLLASAVALPGAEDIKTLNDALVRLSERLTPSVVQISGEGFTASGRNTGSGVILSSEGHIVTNAHVVTGLQRIEVTLAAPRAEGSILRPRGRSLPAKLVGIDRETDLAVIRIEPEAALPAVRLADSDAIRQGQLVLALGNPFGFDNSVSFGVISAVARQLAPDQPMVYIQTDATINPGNSGGPMIDMEGNVVGINALIFSQSGGSEGIGFAIPSNIVRNVTGQIISNGGVTRGEVGIDAQTITPALARALGLRHEAGVVIADVQPGGPAHSSALEIGDVIVALDGKPMENARQLQVNLYSKPIRSLIELDIDRKGQRLKKSVAVLERRDDPERFAAMMNRETGTVRKLGFVGIPLDLKVRTIMPGLRQPDGVLVALPLTQAGALKPGDIIYTVNNRRVATLADVQAAVENTKAGEVVVLQMERQGKLRFIEVAVD
jgi:serine protease Do